MRTHSFVALCGLVLAGAVPASANDTPTLVVTQQGLLLDGGDEPIDGEVTFQVTLYPNSAPQQNETPVWQDSYTVPVRNGRYQLLLGSRLDGGTELLTPAHFPAGEPRWIAIAVNGGSDLSPRMRLGVVPLAISAESLGGRPASDFALAEDVDEAIALLATKAEVEQGFEALSETAAVRHRTLELTEETGAPLVVASSAQVANLNASLLEGRSADDFAPATGSAVYLSKEQAEQLYAPLSGDSPYLTKTDADQAYAPATGSTAYAPASGSSNYVARAADGAVEVSSLTVGGRPALALSGMLGDTSVNNDGLNGPMPLGQFQWASSPADYGTATFALSFAEPPAVVVTPWEPDGAGSTWARIEARTLTGFMFRNGYYATTCSTVDLCPGQGGVAYAALPPGVYVSDEGRKLAVGIFENTDNCATGCSVEFPAGTFSSPPVVVASIDESADQSGPVHLNVVTTTASGFTYSGSFNGLERVTEKVHWIAADPGVSNFGPRLRVGAGIHAANNSAGTLTIAASSAVYVNPPVTLFTANRQGTTASATSVRIEGTIAKRELKYYCFTDVGGGTCHSVNWIAFDQH